MAMPRDFPGFSKMTADFLRNFAKNSTFDSHGGESPRTTRSTLRDVSFSNLRWHKPQADFYRRLATETEKNRDVRRDPADLRHAYPATNTPSNPAQGICNYGRQKADAEHANSADKRTVSSKNQQKGADPRPQARRPHSSPDFVRRVPARWFPSRNDLC